MTITIGAMIITAPSLRGGDPIPVCEACHRRANSIAEPRIVGHARRPTVCALCGAPVPMVPVLLPETGGYGNA